jgi:hypothetical protein
MRVLQQLITYFWERGSLTIEQAHYFVEHGFVHARDLPGYEPRPQVDEEEYVDLGPSWQEKREVLQLVMPDEMDQVEAALAGQTEGKRKRRKSGPKVVEITAKQLGKLLEDILKSRSSSFAALVELARPDYSRNDPRMAAVVLRNIDEEQFPRRLLRAVRARPGLLAQLWEGVDDQPFHDLVAQPRMKGKVVRAFDAVLRSSSAGAWGSEGWVLSVPEVQAVANLMAVRRRLLSAVIGLYDAHWSDLARCVQRPARPKRSWDGLGFGLVLVYNGRARLRKRTPAGFYLRKRLTAAGWREAWANAVALDPAAATPYLIHVFGSVPASRDRRAEDLSAREDFELICPNDWKV